MPARVIRKLLLTCSVLASVALIVLAVRCRMRGPDLLLCGAREGSYYELRADAQGVSVMEFRGWPTTNEPLQWGEPTPKKPSIQNWSEVLKSGRAVPLIDGVLVQLLENKVAAGSRPTATPARPWWAPPGVWSSGMAIIHEPTPKYLRVFSAGSGKLTFTASSPLQITKAPAETAAAAPVKTSGATAKMSGATAKMSVAPAQPSSAPAWPMTKTAARGPAPLVGGMVDVATPSGTVSLPAVSNGLTGTPAIITGPSSGSTINFSGVTTLSLSPTTSPASASGGGGVLSTIQGTTNLTISRPAPTAPPPASAAGWTIMSGMTIRLTPSFPYERYALPYFAAVVLVLTPAWVSGLVALARARRRRVRQRSGLCVNCGYDLRGSAFESACPECGSTANRNANLAPTTTTAAPAAAVENDASVRA